MDLDRLLELNKNYNNSHNNIVDLLQSILEKGELTENDANEIQDKYSKNEDDYNKLDKAADEINKSELEAQLESLRNTKLDMTNILEVLTNGGRTNTLYVDENGNLIINAAKLEELNQVRLTVDEQKKRIDSVIADTEIEQTDGTKVKLKVLYSTLSQTVNGIESNVGTIEGVANDAKSKAEAAATTASQAKQTAEKFSWLVTDGSTSSSITLTDATLQAIANSDIKFKAKNISLEGLVTANDNFKILEDGSIEATNGKFTGEIIADSGKISSNLEVDGLNVSGELSTDTLNVRQINCSNLLVGLTSDINLTVNPGASNASNVFEDNGVFTSIQNCIQSIPKNLNGYTVNIIVLAQTTENITIQGFNGGTLNILFKANNYGHITGHNCSAEILLQGTGSATQTLVSNYKTTGNVNMREGGNTTYNIVQTVPSGAVLLLTDIDENGWGYTTYNGKSGWMSTNTSYMVKEEIYQTSGTSTTIQPSELILYKDYNLGAFFHNCNYVSISQLEIYGKTGNTTNYAIGGVKGSHINITDVKITGSENGILADDGGCVYEYNVVGKVNSIAQKAEHGSIIQIADGTTVNGTIIKDNSSQIIYSSNDTTKDITSDVGSNTNTSTATSTVTITSDSGDCYRYNVYTGWKKDNTVRQGDYGYGDCVGCWFFGNKLSNYATKNITKIIITFTRQQGGIYAAVTHGVKTHNHAYRPTGAPTFNTNFSKSIDVVVGGVGTLVLTDATEIANFMNSKGLGLVPSSYDKAHYSVCSGTCKIELTYTN